MPTLDVPVMARYAFGGGSIRYNVTAGPYVANILSAKTISGGGEIDNKDNMKSWEYGVNLGAGFSYSMDSVTLTLDVRLSKGLNNLADNPATPDVELKTEGIQLMAGFLFPLGN